MTKPQLMTLLIVVTCSGVPGVFADERVRFNRDVRPILSERCFACHGPDASQRKENLRLDVDGRTTGLVTRKIIVPGKPDESELIKRIKSSDPDVRMPPGHDVVLKPAEVAILSQWIAEGADFEGHWAYQPITRPLVPQATSTTSAATSNLNPIDAFVDARLKSLKMERSPTAPPAMLVRRLYLDLTGLPPTPAQVDRFVSNPSESNYAAIVDELLTSKHFAEKQTLAWLDAVRYADTVGFHGDQTISMWPYRDWVLNAFHKNMPFDEFTRQQLAGDLVPNANQQTRTASAFNRLNRMSTEGGAQDKEYRAKYAADRVRTVGMAWLGSTFACCECHDHKFDPISTRDFYSMSAFFADLEEQGFYDKGFDEGRWGPEERLESAEQTEQLKKYDAELTRLRQMLRAGDEKTLAERQSTWEKRVRDLAEKKKLDWALLTPTKTTTMNGAVLRIDGQRLVAEGPNPDHETYHVTFNIPPGNYTAFMVETGADENFAGNRIARGWQSFVVTSLKMSLLAGNDQTPIELAVASGDHAQRSQQYLAQSTLDNNPQTGWGFPHGHSAHHHIVVQPSKPVELKTAGQITLTLDHRSTYRKATIASFTLKASQVPGASPDPQGMPKGIAEAILGTSKISPTPKLAKQHQDFLLQASAPISLKKQIADLELKQAQLRASIPSVLVSKATNPRVTRVLPRGDWMNETGAIVNPAIPALFQLASADTAASTVKAESTQARPGKQNGKRLTRLDLANWLMSEQNPLTPRVMANRIWRQFFGQGLSRNLEDLGSQGDWPANPELLDWLASEFRQPTVQTAGTHAWDYKHLVRLIVTSKTYQQTSIVPNSLLERDPDNRLLARQVPYRLDAELIRDAALQSAGMLNPQFGGPSIRPPQPEGYWSALNYPKREYATSFGADQYRRSVYMHWQRTFLHPSLQVFDAPLREECQVNRSISNTPLQSLTLLNDPIFVEAARALAQQAWLDAIASQPAAQAGGQPARLSRELLQTCLKFAFKRVTSRSASDMELAELVAVYDDAFKSLSADKPAVEQLLAVGDWPATPNVDRPALAALTITTRTILNLHEAITRN